MSTFDSRIVALDARTFEPAAVYANIRVAGSRLGVSRQAIHSAALDGGVVASYRWLKAEVFDAKALFRNSPRLDDLLKSEIIPLYS